MWEEPYQEIKNARWRTAVLYLQARQSLLQQQEFLVAAFDSFDHALEKLQEAEKALRQQKEELAATRREVMATERQHYQHLLDYVSVAYLVVDTKGIVQAANCAAATLLNIPQRFLTGKPIASFISQEQRRGFLNKFMALQGSDQHKWRVSLAPRNSELIEASLTVSLVHDQKGEPLGWGCTLHKISEGNQLESELYLLRSALHHVQESIVITLAELNEPGPKIVFVNEAFTKMTGYTMEEIAGKTPRILHGAKTKRSVLNQLRRNMARGKPFQGELINYRKDLSEYKVQLSCAPIYNEQGQITHFISFQHQVPPEQLETSNLKS